MILGFGIDVFQMLLHLVVQVIDDLLVVDQPAFVVIKVILKSCKRLQVLHCRTDRQTCEHTLQFLVFAVRSLCQCFRSLTQLFSSLLVSAGVPGL